VGKILILKYVHGKNDFAEISKNLARSENNFVGASKNNYVRNTSKINSCKKV